MYDDFSSSSKKQCQGSTSFNGMVLPLAYLTEREKSPGLVWLGLHKKLPSWPFEDKSNSSACALVMCA